MAYPRLAFDTCAKKLLDMSASERTGIPSFKYCGWTFALHCVIMTQTGVKWCLEGKHWGWCEIKLA
jgi:hypothetical protein